MSDITAAIQSVLSDVSVDSEGVVSITRNGLSVLLGISRSLLTRSHFPKKLAENLALCGLDRAHFLDCDTLPDTAVSVIIHYYAYESNQKSEMAKKLALAFSAVGIRKFFQDAKGFTAMNSTPMSHEDTVRLAYKTMGDMVKLYDYAANKPGLKNVLNHGIANGAKTLPGMLSLDDILDYKMIELTNQQKSAVGMYAAVAYRNSTGKKPATEQRKRKDKSGKVQYYKVAVYPVDFLPLIENALELGYMS